MKMFVREEEFAELELLCNSTSKAAPTELQVELIWHLRQRDSRKACDMAQTLRQQLPEPAYILRARLLLVEGESNWLFAHFEQAKQFARQALAIFSREGQMQGCCDAHWLLSAIAIDQGRHQDSDQELQAAARAAREAQDELRAALCDTAQARWAILANARDGDQLWGQRLNFALAEHEPSLAAWIEDYLALRTSQSSDFGTAARHFMRSHQAALSTGQIRAAIIARTNMAEDFNKLSDHQAALEQFQYALELARPTGWPRSVGACLMHTADTMRRLDRLEAAHELLGEALHVMQPLKAARSYAHALQYMGDLALDRGQFELALESFIQLEGRADALHQADFKGIALLGRAHALAALGQGEEAQRVALLGLQMSREQSDTYGQIASYEVLAEIHARYDLALSQPCQYASHSLHFLMHAVELAETIPGYSLPSQLLDKLAREYARVSQFESAYQVALQASAMRERTHSDQATNRAIAMQISQQTERARAEGEHHRQMAKLEAKRAAVLQQTSATLEHLSEIGQEITAHLDPNAVFHVLHRHVQDMLPAQSYAIYVSHDDGASLRRCFGVEAGKVLRESIIDLQHPTANSARCARERCEVLLDIPDQQHIPPKVHEPGTLHNLSALYVPLVVNERLIGVMTVQSQLRHAYGERERVIFRTLCAYGAIALDNAYAYLRLQEAQAQLVSQEKLAALGALVAGVAHELNTPIGNSLTIASTMQDKCDEVELKILGPGIKRSEIVSFVRNTRDASNMMVRGLGNAAELLYSFKQVAMDRTTAQKREFELLQTCHEIVATMMNQIRRAGHKIDVDVPAGIKMHSYPGPLGQVITNFINNALLHAFEGAREGQMHLRANLLANEQVKIEFADNGRGISQQHIKKIFEPFFTTKLGQGGSGLGLSISYNIATSILHGQISVHSVADVGTCFTLVLPLVIADQAQS